MNENETKQEPETKTIPELIEACKVAWIAEQDASVVKARARIAHEAADQILRQKCFDLADIENRLSKAIRLSVGVRSGL